jgi:hypothetical protein
VCLSEEAGGCWTDADCSPGGKCTEEWVIPWWTGYDFGEDLPDVPGTCCVAPNGMCYEDDDCMAGQYCFHGLSVGFPEPCFPGGLGPSPGECDDLEAWPEDLCLVDAECAPGERCVGEWLCPEGAACLDQAHPGVCLPDPFLSAPADDCYEALDCLPGQVCAGAWVCDVIEGSEPCGGAMATPGVCE